MESRGGRIVEWICRVLTNKYSIAGIELIWSYLTIDEIVHHCCLIMNRNDFTALHQSVVDHKSQVSASSHFSLCIWSVLMSWILLPSTSAPWYEWGRHLMGTNQSIQWPAHVNVSCLSAQPDLSWLQSSHQTGYLTLHSNNCHCGDRYVHHRPGELWLLLARGGASPADVMLCIEYSVCDQH